MSAKKVLGHQCRKLGSVYVLILIRCMLSKNIDADHQLTKIPLIVERKSLNNLQNVRLNLVRTISWISQPPLLWMWGFCGVCLLQTGRKKEFTGLYIFYTIGSVTCWYYRHRLFIRFGCLRLRDIHEESAAQHQPRKRSNSLPIPKIEVSFYQSNENKKTENNNKDFIEVPELKDVSLLAGTLRNLRRRNFVVLTIVAESPYTNQKQTSDESLHKRTASEKSRKRMKIADLKTFVETKLLSKSDKALEKIGHDDPKPLDQSQPVRFHSIAKRILDVCTSLSLLYLHLGISS